MEPWHGRAPHWAECGPAPHDGLFNPFLNEEGLNAPRGARRQVSDSRRVSVGGGWESDSGGFVLQRVSRLENRSYSRSVDGTSEVDMEKAMAGFLDPRANEPKKEVTEEQFLKELFLFMNKRDTPIERVPHLGFKQIDLFLMFKTVNTLGGYQQVTAQQLWKQVYNTLGGNPRSTSAATCTRRHYEKLLLPYECHIKGILLSTVAQPKPVHHFPYAKDDNLGPCPSKRRILHMYHNPFQLQVDPRGPVFSLPPPYPFYYPPSRPTLLSSPAMTPQTLPVLEPHPSIPPPDLSPTDMGKEPLERLRNLSDWYKSSSGLVQQPLNLSKKSCPQEPVSSPVSSFSPPSSSKNPKFLNKPSTLYNAHHAEVPREDDSETPGTEARPGVLSYSHPAGGREADVAEVKALGEPSVPPYSRPTAPNGDSVEPKPPQTSGSPKTDFTLNSNEVVQRLYLQHLLPGIPRERNGKMEFEVPLSVLHTWIKMYGSSAFVRRPPSFSPPEERPGKRTWSDFEATPTNLIHQVKVPSSPEDLRLRNTSPIPSSFGTSRPLNANHSLVTGSGSGSSLSGSPPPNPGRYEVFPFDLRDPRKTSSSKSPCPSDESQPRKCEAGPTTRTQPDFISKSCLERKNPKPETQTSSLLNTDSNPLMYFTTEEVMKLKKIISSSS